MDKTYFDTIFFNPDDNNIKELYIRAYNFNGDEIKNLQKLEKFVLSTQKFSKIKFDPRNHPNLKKVNYWRKRFEFDNTKSKFMKNKKKLKNFEYIYTLNEF